MSPNQFPPSLHGCTHLHHFLRVQFNMLQKRKYLQCSPNKTPFVGNRCLTSPKIEAGIFGGVDTEISKPNIVQVLLTHLQTSHVTQPNCLGSNQIPNFTHDQADEKKIFRKPSNKTIPSTTCREVLHESPCPTPWLQPDAFYTSVLRSKLANDAMCNGSFLEYVGCKSRVLFSEGRFY